MDMHQQVEEIVQTINELDIQEPSDYVVVLLNDDHTPMEFVVHVLEDVFKHARTDAVDITTKIHHEGEGVAGVYTFEIAEQKGLETTVLARSEGFPLKVRLDPK